jgi:hypothetical protein
MSQGFVYALGNKAMPGIFKVGMTSGSPHKRAKELSSATGVASPFVVLCYGEYADARAKERSAHERLAEFRWSENREFFKCHLEHVIGELYWDADWLSYCEHVSEEWRLEQPHNQPRKLELVKA